MRIRDWSSDVCSSDLGPEVHRDVVDAGDRTDRGLDAADAAGAAHALQREVGLPDLVEGGFFLGRGAPCRHVVARCVGLFDEERAVDHRSEEHTSELQSLMRNSYAVFCLKKQKT